MISVNRNFGSLVGRHNLLTANNAVETAVQRLSSGARINSAADDSAGMAVVSKMDSQITGLSVAIKNTLDAISLFDTASAGLQTTSAIAQRVRELAVQNSNGHLSVTDRAAAQLEVDAINAELLRIAESTNFTPIRVPCWIRCLPRIQIWAFRIINLAPAIQTRLIRQRAVLFIRVVSMPCHIAPLLPQMEKLTAGIMLNAIFMKMPAKD